MPGDDLDDAAHEDFRSYVAARSPGELRPVGTGQDFLDGVVLLDRDPRADRDRLQLLDGDADLDRPLLTAPVTGLLCGVRECG